MRPAPTPTPFPRCGRGGTAEGQASPRNVRGIRCNSHRFVSTAGAAAWLPHSKPRDTGNLSENRILPKRCFHWVWAETLVLCIHAQVWWQGDWWIMGDARYSTRFDCDPPPPRPALARRVLVPTPTPFPRCGRGGTAEGQASPRNVQGIRCNPHRFVSTAGAAAWLPHSKPRATSNLSENGILPKRCFHWVWAETLVLCIHAQVWWQGDWWIMGDARYST